MSGEDPHSPTTAGPDPGGAPEAFAPAADTATQPTPTVGAASASYNQPAGSALLGDGSAGSVDPHPERLVGAAFAGGLVAALLLKGMAKRKHA